MRRAMLLALTFVLSCVGVANAQDGGWVCPDGFEGQTLRFFNWADYVGETTIPDFEAACGVTVEYIAFDSNDHMLEIMSSEMPEYDLAISSDFVVKILSEDGLIQKLDPSLIPNLANLNPAFVNPFYDPTGEYAVPYQWGTIGIGYNKTIFADGEITSWADFFAYDGPVGWIDDQRALLGVALLVNGLDPNSTDESEIAAASAWLAAQNRDADGASTVIEVTSIDMRPLLMDGDVAMGIGYSGDLMRANVDCECDDFAYILPQEGTNLWADNLVIPANAQNVALAHAFIDYILDAQVGADLTNWVSYATPNSAAQSLTDEAMQSDPAVYPSQDMIERSFFAAYVGEAESYYEAAWEALLSALNG